MNSITNVTLVGVGGQGILLTSDILARTAVLAGCDVRKSEVHGMSQRGGSVSSQVRFGERVYSPIIPDGQTDVLVAFERLEAIRSASLLAPTGQAIVDTRDIVPLTVSSGLQKGVENMAYWLDEVYGSRIRCVDATALAVQCGNARAANLVLAGVLSCYLQFEPEAWHEAIQSRLKPALVPLNLKAFDAGRQCVLQP